MHEDAKIARFSGLMQEYFLEASRAAGVEINPTKRNRTDIVLAGRVYEETRGSREFIVSPEEGRALDAFVKDTGINYEISLLQIFAKLTEDNFPILWRAYFMWMHENVSEREVLTILVEEK